MFRSLLWVLAIVVFAFSRPLVAEIQMAPGLRIQRLAGHDMVPDCTNLTVDGRGRVIVSGPGYIRMLTLDDKRGSVIAVDSLLDRPSHGAHGLCIENEMLYFVGDDGVWRMQDTDADGVVDSAPKQMLEIKTGGEHDAHALRKGPDGSWYLLAGNKTAKMFQLQNVDTTEVPNPRAGAIWKISADWSQREVWAHGFRNAFDFDFAPDHTIITFDSDGERDVSLPWYRPTRVYRVSQGDDAGWVTRSWKRPNVDTEMPRVLAEFGRGSPTGVLRSTNTRLPARFDEGVFVLDWTFGRILFVADDGTTEKVAHATESTGFAVTDLDAFPDGPIVVSVGGRGSQGGLYLIDAITPRSQARNQVTWESSKPATLNVPLRDAIRGLRRSPERLLDLAAAQMAVTAIENPQATRRQLLDGITLLIESLGGLGAGDPRDARGKYQVAAVFDGYRSVLRPALPKPLLDRAAKQIVERIPGAAGDPELVNELIRAVAVLEPEFPEAFKVIANDLQAVASPTDKLHRLIALSRLPAARDDKMTAQIIEAMIEIPVLIESQNLKLDRNWNPRLTELMLALHRRDALMPGRLVAHPEFGQPAHLVWTDAMDPEELERLRVKLLRQSGGPPTEPSLARFIALGNDAVARSVIRLWLEDPSTRDAAWLAISRYPGPSDAEQMKLAAQSVDPVVRESARKALTKIGVELPQPQPTKSETAKWLSEAPRILSLAGNAEKGKALFQERKCAACHDGVTALGPSLQGVGRRFNADDLWRATVDPSHTVPDRYRAQMVLTTDDRILVGMRIYESVDGITLLTASGETVRVNAENIAEQRDSKLSLMPEGLLIGLDHQQASDLMAYLQKL
ncbi:MAG: c-type cytochrome [Planctomycetaceae bacterium]|nr:c-type cytochrome [Planctomycetaceae bacterium]